MSQTTTALSNTAEKLYKEKKSIHVTRETVEKKTKTAFNPQYNASSVADPTSSF